MKCLVSGAAVAALLDPCSFEANRHSLPNYLAGTIDRPGADVFATELSFNHYSGEHPRDYFAGEREWPQTEVYCF